MGTLTNKLDKRGRLTVRAEYNHGADYATWTDCDGNEVFAQGEQVDETARALTGRKFRDGDVKVSEDAWGCMVGYY